MSSPRFLIIQVIKPHDHQDLALASMAETVDLIYTFGGEVVQKTVQHRANPHPGTFIGSGKLEWLQEEVKSKEIDVVLINNVINPAQVFRLEKTLWAVNPKIKVWDRVDLILNIFKLHAHSTESKLQIELAEIDHLGPRIYGLGGTVLSRQGGGVGMRGGSGETNLEFEKRKHKKRRQDLLKKLKTVQLQKSLRLQYRQELGFGPVALVGYTSAGKTSLFNTLTGKSKDTASHLFTTLDTVVGKLKSEELNAPILISDTIGFIQDLPHELIDAFRSTLMESLNARLILHLVDASDPLFENKIEIVSQILTDLKIKVPVWLVFTKADLACPLKNHLKDHHLVSVKTLQGIAHLKSTLATYFLLSQGNQSVTIAT